MNIFGLQVVYYGVIFYLYFFYFFTCVAENKITIFTVSKLCNLNHYVLRLFVVKFLKLFMLFLFLVICHLMSALLLKAFSKGAPTKREILPLLFFLILCPQIFQDCKLKEDTAAYYVYSK